MIKKVKVLIIDDEKPARTLIRAYLNDFKEVEIIGECANGFEGIKEIQHKNPDIIFLDIQMPKVSGFEMLEVIEKPPKVIFTTAFDQYAVKAFEQNAIDYLLKPFSNERFNTAFSKALNAITSTTKHESSNSEDVSNLTDKEKLMRIVVKKGSELIVIPIHQVLFIESDDDYVWINSEKGKFLKYKTMKFYQEHLSSNQFVRIHRSYIVNVNKVLKIEQYDKDNHLAILSPDQKLKVSKSGYKLLKEVLNI